MLSEQTIVLFKSQIELRNVIFGPANRLRYDDSCSLSIINTPWRTHI